jgi:DNA-binding transcriptional MerR regulator
MLLFQDAAAPVDLMDVTPEADLTIDELAAKSQVPSRTIRFYQSKGVLPKPIMKGRVAYYGKAHEERLELIATLQDRGLRIDAIRELAARLDRGEVDIGEWLGLEEQLQRPWDDDQPKTVSEDELYEIGGRKRAGLIGDLMRVKLVEKRGNVFYVASPALLVLACRLEAAGLDLEVVHQAREILEKHIGRAARDLTEHVMSRMKLVGDGDESDYAKAVEHLRPLAMDGVRVLFAHAMQRELRELAQSPRVAKVAGRRRLSDRRSRADRRS